VATLDAPIPEGKNAVWCASFLAAWKTLAEETAEAPLILKGGEATAALLNNAADPRSAIPQESLYVKSGWMQQGVAEKIKEEMARQFPSKEPPTFPGAAADSFLAYAYLEASVKFSLPYFQNRKPLEFTDAAGRSTSVNSFGIRYEDDYAYDALRAQARVLFRKGAPRGRDLEFAIDLCPDSKPNRIVVALINREPTLAAAVARVERECVELEKPEGADRDYADYLRRIGPNDVLLVPDMLWRLSHRFAELEGKRFTNGKLKDQRIDVAQQDIFFRLDRSGAELASESKMEVKPIPTHFIFDRPFLIYMTQRGSITPYLALWVDNAELLSQWQDAD
jgi:hypothetical protein